MTNTNEREKAWELLREYNKDTFHLRHALTIEGVMKFLSNTILAMRSCEDEVNKAVSAL